MKKTFFAIIFVGLGFALHAAEPPAPSFEKLQLSDKFYAEGAYYADFNKDGKLDIVAGPFGSKGRTSKRVMKSPRPKPTIPTNTRTIF